jgi:hypothetical protein
VGAHFSSGLILDRYILGSAMLGKVFEAQNMISILSFFTLLNFSSVVLTIRHYPSGDGLLITKEKFVRTFSLFSKQYSIRK